MGLFATDAGCLAQMKYVKLPDWDMFTGKGLVIFCDDADPNHCGCVVDIIHTILPEATIYSGTIGTVKLGGVLTKETISCRELGITLPFDDFIVKYNVSMINNSTDGGQGTTVLPEAVWMKEKIKQYNLIMTGAAGNGSSCPTTQPYSGACLVVTSALLKEGKAVASVRSIGENVDFAMFNGFQPGTSFSSPFLLGMAGKLRCRNPKITQDEVKAYFKSHREDLLVDGFDIQSGWGLPILGIPDTVIEMQVDRNVMTVDGIDVILDQPLIFNPKTNRTLMPLRAPIEALGATVSWNQANKKVTITKKY